MWNAEWEQLYLFSLNIFKEAECLVCYQKIKRVCAYGLQRHYKRCHPEHILLNEIERKELIKKLKNDFRLKNNLAAYTLTKNIKAGTDKNTSSSTNKSTSSSTNEQTSSSTNEQISSSTNNNTSSSTCSQIKASLSKNTTPSSLFLPTPAVHAPYSPQTNEEELNAVLKWAKRKMYEERICPDKRSRRCLPIEMEKKTIERSVMGLTIEDGVALSLFDSKNMQAILRPLYEAISDQDDRNFKVNEAKAEEALNLVANYIRNDFSNDLHWRLLSLKIDTDLQASSNTFCVSVQFVNEGQVENRVLGLIDLKDNIKLSEIYIQEILNKFNIDVNQIISASWDNTKDKFDRQVENGEYLKEIESFENYPDIYVGDYKIEPYVGVIAHQCVLDLFKNFNIFQPFLECRNLVKFLNDKSNGYYEIFDMEQLKIPQLDSPWKWGSTYTMINGIYLARNILKNVKYTKLDCPEDQFNLNDNLWSFVEAYCKVLSSLQKSILKYYSEELHYGDFYAQWLKCKLLTENLVSSNKTQQNYMAIISTELLKCIEKRNNERLRNERFEACLYLDPRFQHTLNSQQKANAVGYLKNIWNRAKLYNADVVKSASDVNAQTAPMQQFCDDENAYLNDFLGQNVQMKYTTTADVYNTLEKLKLPFKMVDTNILLFWREQKFSQPKIHALSTICFAMPATQIYCKTRYSHIYPTEDNSKISTLTKENLLYIRLNAHIFHDVITQLSLFQDDKSTPVVREEEFNEDTSVAKVTHIILPPTTAIIPPLAPITKPRVTAIYTPAGTAFLPPNTTIRQINTIKN